MVGVSVLEVLVLIFKRFWPVKMRSSDLQKSSLRFLLFIFKNHKINKNKNFPLFIEKIQILTHDSLKNFRNFMWIRQVNYKLNQLSHR